MNELGTDGLAEAIHLLSDEQSIVRLSGETLASIVPLFPVQTYTTRGFPARSIGAACQFIGSSEIHVTDDRSTFYDLFLPIIRLAAGRPNPWVEVVRDGLLTAAELRDLFKRCPALQGFDVQEWGLFVATLGKEPVGGGNVLVPAGIGTLTDDSRSRIAALVPRLSEALRIAALLANASPGLYALDHLLSSRSDAVFLLSMTGQLLGASPAGELLLLRHRDLSLILIRHAAVASRRAANLELPRHGLQVHITPCSQRGGSAALLAVVQSSGEAHSNRGRLTRRQAELLELLEQGLSNKEIAKRMGLSPLTVKSSLENLYRMAHVSGRVALVGWRRGNRLDDSVTEPM